MASTCVMGSIEVLSHFLAASTKTGLRTQSNTHFLAVPQTIPTRSACSTRISPLAHIFAMRKRCSTNFFTVTRQQN